MVINSHFRRQNTYKIEIYDKKICTLRGCKTSYYNVDSQGTLLGCLTRINIKMLNAPPTNYLYLLAKKTNK